MSSPSLDKLMSERSQPLCHGGYELNSLAAKSSCQPQESQQELVEQQQQQQQPRQHHHQQDLQDSGGAPKKPGPNYHYHHQPQPPASGYSLAQKIMTTKQASTTIDNNRNSTISIMTSNISKIVINDDDVDRNENSSCTNERHQQQSGADIEYRYRVGYWWSDKKSQKINATKLKALFAERQCEFVKLDFERHLDQQGPFDLIAHKISDILVKADQGDSMAKKTISAFESYVRKHPQTVVLDPLDNNRALLDRYKQYRLIEQSDLARENVVFTPPFVHLTSTNIDVNRGRIRRSKITFPIVCKPILAQGTQGAHQMCIIFNEAGLKDIKPPCVAQSFVNHNAKLFKLFVIKDKYYIMERPSLKNFQAGDRESVFFFSHDISKPNSSSSLTELDDIDKQNLKDLIDTRANGNKDSLSNTDADGDYELTNCYSNSDNQQQEIAVATVAQYSPPLKPSNEILSKIVKIFSEKLGLTFYGIDIIIENGTNRYAIIDMNTFPGYDGVENFLTIFCDVVCDAIPKERIDHLSLQQQQTRLLNKRKPTEHDSGIEST